MYRGTVCLSLFLCNKPLCRNRACTNFYMAANVHRADRRDDIDCTSSRCWPTRLRRAVKFLIFSFKSNVRETWRVILVSEADIFLSESLCILAERLSQSETRLPLRQICYYSPPEEVGVFSTEIKNRIISVPSLQISQCI